MIQVYEARVRIDNMDAQKAAGAMPASAIRADTALATQAAAAVDAMRTSAAEWFNFLIRLALTPQPLTRDMSLDWKFYGEIR